MGEGKKALFLLYMEANSWSLGADITQYVLPETRCAPAPCHTYHRGANAREEIQVINVLALTPKYCQSCALSAAL